MHDIPWLLFIATSLVLIATPGQDMVLVISRSIAQGPRAGVATAAGVSVGLLGHTALAAIGVGAILQASEWLFFALKLLGAAYLIYLGVQLFRSAPQDFSGPRVSAQSFARLFMDGALSNVANPKIAIFFFAFLPQFLAADTLHPAQSVSALGMTFAALTFLVKGPVGFAAGMFSAWLRSRPSALNALNQTSGVILVGLGLKLAAEGR